MPIERSISISKDGEMYQLNLISKNDSDLRLNQYIGHQESNIHNHSRSFIT